ncbi:MAG: hypothetical protein ABIJ45_09080 [Candidatus Zixiibacteriota bacterium]
MKICSKIIIPLVILVLLLSSLAEARQKGTIKTYSGKTYFDVTYIIYEDLEEIRFHDAFGNSGIVNFNDVFRLLDENGNDITSFIRPYLVRPHNLLASPNYNPSDLSLGAILNPRLILGVNYGRIHGDFLVDRNDEKLGEGATSIIGLNVGLILHFYKRAELYFSGTYGGLRNNDYNNSLRPEILHYDFLIRFLLGTTGYTERRMTLYFNTGLGVFTLNDSDNFLKYTNLLTTGFGLGAVYELSYNFAFDFNLMYNFVHNKNIRFNPSDGHMLNFKLGMNYRL